MAVDAAPDRDSDLLEETDPELSEALACVFGIRAHELRTYRALLRVPDSTVADLADELDRDRSNVSRSLSTLREAGLATRRRRLLDGGGHVFEYTATPPAAARELLHEALDAWAAGVHDRIEEFADETA
ncbi:helix-turn-helix domain-containing protein [Haloarcula salina]|uniref:helix-turn-helix domain-containing protein n=1 Tax=Haloarcula salina TaxID=1429914 RepID=UPI003C6F61A6